MQRVKCYVIVYRENDFFGLEDCFKWVAESWSVVDHWEVNSCTASFY